MIALSACTVNVNTGDTAEPKAEPEVQEIEEPVVLNNLYDPATAEVGDQYGQMTLVKKEKFNEEFDFLVDNFIGTFEGEATVSGKYTYELQSMIPGGCFYVDDETLENLPRINTDRRTAFFCLGTENPLGTENRESVTIVIDSYTDYMVGAGVANQANVVRIVE